MTNIKSFKKYKYDCHVTNSRGLPFSLRSINIIIPRLGPHTNANQNVIIKCGNRRYMKRAIINHYHFDYIAEVAPPSMIRLKGAS